MALWTANRHSFVLKVIVSIALFSLSVLPSNAQQAACKPSESGKAEDFGLPAPSAATKGNKFYFTAYIIQQAENSDADDAVPIAGPDGKTFGLQLDHLQWCLAADEGTVAVHTGDGEFHTFNYAGHVSSQFTDCSRIFTHFSPSMIQALGRSAFNPVPKNAPFGLGARGYRLVPYRSVAVDKTGHGFAKVGDVLFIPALRGACISAPNGKTYAHDGYVMAVDTGGAIHGAHMDFFQGPRTTDRIVKNLRSDPKHMLDAVTVQDAAIKGAVSALHLR